MQATKKILPLVMVLVILSAPLLAASVLESSVPAATVPLPLLPEASDEELLEAEGEFWWFLVGLVIGGGARAVYENWFDEDYGIDKDDGREIAGTALVSGVGGSCGGMIAAIAAFMK